VLTDFAGVPVSLKHEHASEFALDHRRQMGQRLDVKQFVVDRLQVLG